MTARPAPAFPASRVETADRAVTIVIPSWNGRELLEQTLPSIAAQSSPAVRTIIVDNGSTDDTIAYLRLNWPAVEVIPLRDNLGFAAATNAGIRAVRTPLVALINNDVELREDWLATMTDALLADPQAGYVTGKMLSFVDRDTIDDTGTIFSWYAQSWSRGRGELDRGQYDTPGYVFGACAGAAVYRTETFKRVGLFDEAFFAYAEDTDWAFRAQLVGIRCRYHPDGVSYHMGRATSKRMPGLTSRLGFRNTAFIVLKGYSARELGRNAPRLFYWWSKALYGSLKDGWAGDFAKAQAEIFRALPALLSKRREIQRKRVMDTAYLDTVITLDVPPSRLLRSLGRLFRVGRRGGPVS